MAWTTSDLLTTVKNRQMFPDASTGSLSPAALLQMGTEELHITLIPMIIGAREKYYETYTDTAYSSSVTTLSLPNRAIGGTTSLIQYINTPYIKPLNPIDPTGVNTLETSPVPLGFYFQNNSIIPYPPPSTSSAGYIRIRWQQRPNRLEQITNCAQITGFDGTSVVTCAPVSTWTTANIFDFIPQIASQATPYNINAVITGISSTTMTFTLSTAQAALVKIGDWIALAEYTPIPEIPFEFQPVLAQAIAVKGLESINDQVGLQTAVPKLMAYMQSAVKLITQRDQEGQKKVVSGWRML